MEKEIYKKFEDTRYSISNYGNVRNDLTGRILKPCKNKIGYMVVTLSIEKAKEKSYNLHTLVAGLHVDNPDPQKYPEVGHKDDNKENNRADNLYWTDRQENIHHNNDARLAKAKQTMLARGTSFWGKLPIPVKCLDTGVTYASAADAAAQLNLWQPSICACCRGRQHTTGGMHFAYADNV